MAGMAARARARRLLLIAFVAACAIWYFKQNILDAIFYYFAAQHILHGESPFLTADYIYPPLLACLLVPLAAFDYFTARWIWFVFSHACLLTAAFMLWRRLGRDRIATAVIGFQVPLAEPIKSTLGKVKKATNSNRQQGDNIVDKTVLFCRGACCHAYLRRMVCI
jgi:hypothetical protein